MKQSLSSKPKQPNRKPVYDDTLEEQTMLYWRLQQQWCDREVPGYTWKTGEALRLLGSMAENYALPANLRTSAENLNFGIIMNHSSVRPLHVQDVCAEVLTLN